MEKRITLSNQNFTATGMLSEPEQGATGPWGNPNPSTHFLSSGKLEPDTIVDDSEGNRWLVLRYEQIGNRRLYILSKEV